MAGKRDNPTRITEREKRAREQFASMKDWRRIAQTAKMKLTDELKVKYCEHLARYGQKAAAAESVNVSTTCIQNNRELDPVFDAMCNEAFAHYADRVHTLAWKLMDGVKKPIVGGKDKDEIVAYEMVHAVPIVQMELKRVNPEYKDRSEIDMKGNASAVLIAPPNQTPEEWLKATQAAAETTKDPREEK